MESGAISPRIDELDLFERPLDRRLLAQLVDQLGCSSRQFRLVERARRRVLGIDDDRLLGTVALACVMETQRNSQSRRESFQTLIEQDV